MIIKIKYRKKIKRFVSQGKEKLIGYNFGSIISIEKLHHG